VLPDEVLLGIFDFCVSVDEELEEQCNTRWEVLVHVCRRWRYIVFAAPHRLDLRLVCTAGMRVKEMLDIWPPLPIDLCVYDHRTLNEENVTAALGHNDRVCEIYVESSKKGTFKRFKELSGSYNYLSLLWKYLPPPTVPDSFLCGSAPGLRSLCLKGMAFPGLPKLLLSTTSLIRLRLEDLPYFGHISPCVMANCLSSLTRLEELRLTFLSRPLHDQGSPRPPPLTRTILPKLASLSFKGTIEYWEDLFTWIDAPLHNYMNINFFDTAIFDTSLMSMFNVREELVQALDRAHMHFGYCDLLDVTLSSREGTTGVTSLKLSVKYGDPTWELQSLSRSRRQFSPPPGFSHGCFDACSLPWTADVEKAEWLEFLLFFAAVEDLYLSEGAALCIAPVLRDHATRGGEAVRVLPALKNLFIEPPRPSNLGPLLEPIHEFDVARELAGHPVVVQWWE